MVPPLPTDGSTTAAAPEATTAWRSWRSAWVDAAYAPDGFWSTQQPGDHFTTAVGLGPFVAQAVARVVPAGGQVVVDVGAGDAQLLTALVDLLPDVTLVGVDRRPRPTGLDPRVRWVTDHWDVDAGRWTHGGPEAWTALPLPLYVAHEWLDDLPVPVVQPRAEVWREVEVDGSGQERLGETVGDRDATWLARWWATGGRAEVGRARDVAWGALVGSALERGGSALAVDYGHLAPRRPVDGSFAAYGRGRRRTPVPDGSVNLTAGVAVDALVAAGEALGAATLLLERQASVLGRVAADDRSDDDRSETVLDPLQALVRRSGRAAATRPDRWGELWWLLQGPDDRRDLLA